VAFYPLFPLLWKLLPANGLAAFVLNGIIYLLSLFWLGKTLRLKREVLLMFAMLPSAVFFFAPYTESLFFLAGAMILVGGFMSKFWLICLGLFIASLSRPAFLVLIPALIMVDFLTGKNTLTIIKRAFTFSLVASMALICVATIQFMDTGEWLRFFSVQSEWDNELRFPSLPFRSWSGGFVTRLDAAALFIGFMAIAFIMKSMADKILKREITIHPHLVTSVGYLAGMTILVLAFRGGSLFSLNRFLFATPFLLPVLAGLYEMKIKLNPLKILTLFLVVNSFFLLFHSYNHIETFLKFLLISAFMCFSIVTLTAEKKSRILNFVMIVFLIAVQIAVTTRFLLGNWVA
jgi:hypothetical protein